MAKRAADKIRFIPADILVCVSDPVRFKQEFMDRYNIHGTIGDLYKFNIAQIELANQQRKILEDELADARGKQIWAEQCAREWEEKYRSVVMNNSVKEAFNHD